MNLNPIRERVRLIILSFGTNFLSGFGQSFLLSLFTPYLLTHLKLSNSGYGLIYSSATLVSGLLIPYPGSRLDYKSPKRFILISFLGLAIFSFSFSYIEHPVHLWITILGLRFFGQGMFSHISSTLISTRFTKNRGKALSIANLGFPASEAILPVVIVWMTSSMTVSVIWKIIGYTLIAFAFFVPVLLKDAKSEDELTTSGLKIQFLEFKGIRSNTFWYYATPGIFPAFVFTALFLYHSVLLESRNLPFNLIAKGLVLFALTRLLGSLASGALVDKFGSKKLFPLYLAPLTLGLLILAYFKNETSFLLYLALGGLSQGAASTIMNSIWVELYGTESLAKVRSQMASLAVIGTAAGPFIFGLLIDYLFGIDGAVIVLAALQFFVFIASAVLKKKFLKEAIHE